MWEVSEVILLRPLYKMESLAFTPFYRPSSIGTPSKEPWAMGDEVEEFSREAIKLRYQFLPYLYNEFL